MTAFSGTLVAPADQNRSGFDDGTTWQVGDNYIRLGRISGAVTIDTGGIVFANFLVPQGATINTCPLQLYNTLTRSRAARPTRSMRTPRSRNRTSAAVIFHPPRR